MNNLRKIVRQIINDQILEGHYTTWKNIEEMSSSFAAEEAEIIQKLAKHFKIGKTAPLGSGTQGFAYYIPNNRVLKITQDKGEAAESFKIKGKKLKHLANIYEVYSLKGKYEGTYVIISELLNRDDKIYEADDLLDGFFDSEFSYGINYFWEDYSNGSVSKEELKDYKKRIKEFKFSNFDNNKSNLVLWYLDGMLAIIDEIKKNGIETNDWTPGNLGIKKDGTLAMYDLGYGGYHPPDEIQNIHLNERKYTSTKFTDISDEQVRNHYNRSRGKNFAQFIGKDGKPYYVSQFNPNTFQVHTREGGALKPIGHLYLSQDNDSDTYIPDAGGAYAVQVNPEYRRLGIGSAMYDYAESLGYNIKPSDIQYPEAKAMWMKRKPELKEYWSADEYPEFTDGQFNPIFHDRAYPPMMNMNTAPISEIELSQDELSKKDLPLQYHFMWGDFIKSKGAAVREIVPNLGQEAIENTNTDALVKDLAENDPAIYDEFAEWIYQSLHGSQSA